MTTLLYFIAALVILITVHEFGHFIVARLCGVKVLRFSIGFGKPLIKWVDKKKTEFVLAVIPIGGYVKMLDETEGAVAAKDLPYSFNRQSVAKRIAIVIAGPLFNFIFAIVALWLMFIIGMESLAPIIDNVSPDSIAANAGVKPNQEIIQFNKTPVNSWRQFQFALMPLLGSGETVDLKTKSLDDNQLFNYRINLSKFSLNPKQSDILKSLGIKPFIPTILPVVGKVVRDMPAESAGFKPGDKILQVNQQKINDWFELTQIVKNNPGKQLQMLVLRDDKQIKLAVIAQAVKREGQLVGVIGLLSKKPNWSADLIRRQQYSLIAAIAPAIKQTGELSYATLTLLGRLITGKLSVKTISGPVGIAQGAGQSGRSGVAYYLAFLALVSISLGILNLLPIPVLDGGHLVYYLLEWVTGKPVSERAKSIGSSIGVLFILAILILALFNDVSRLVS